jgi:hypothetical protein
MIITRVEYNYFVDINSIEQFTCHEVGMDGVVRIRETVPSHSGDKWKCYVEFEDGKVIAVSNINRVFYEKNNPESGTG